MSLVPTFQIYPSTFFDSFHSSFSKFHGTPLHFFRYGSSVSLKTHNFHAIHSSFDSESNNEQNPRGNSRFVYRNNNGRSQISVKKDNFDATQNSFDSESSVEQNPERNSSFLVRNSSGRSPISQSNQNVNVSGSGWIEKWNENNQRDRHKPTQAVLNYRTSGEFEKINSGGGGSSTMEKIVEKLKKFGYINNVNEEKERAKERVIEKGSIEDIFYVEEGVLPNSRGGFSADSPLGVENVFGGDGEVRFPWEKPVGKEEGKSSVRSQGRTSLAELTLPESELRRLRNLAFQTKSKKKIGGSGVTQAVVDLIHEKWKSSEIVRLKIEGAPALNMKRMHEILERKTGGLVIWRSGTAVVLYRGVSYEVPSTLSNKRTQHKSETPYNSFSTITDKTSRDHLKLDSYTSVHAPQESLETVGDEKTNTEPLPEIKYENEVDKLLDELGPRYTDWAGLDPLPVDADMLPGFVLGFEPPFRILPYGVRSTLGVREATALRRLARVLPPHFALGRSRQLQGLAVAVVKLWERSSIAKIALKRGVQLTTSERMAEDIKKLTGGILLSRNKDFLVFYRGKNFLSREVTEVLLERERLAKALQDEEEQARLRASASIIPTAEIIEQSRTAGTLAETLDADARWGKRLDIRDRQNIMREAEVLRHANLVRKLERKLSFAERKLMKAERALSKVEEFLKPSERVADPESISDEERFMFRKLGLRMKAFLLLGRRGVFDGTVENMHLHWKYRELVKIILKAKNFDAVKKVALSLEAESGGVLVSVDKISKGYAVIVFRGKDYARPPMLRPKNLLTKRKALARSIELQRREALYNHISALQRNVNKLRSEIKQMEVVEERGDDELYDELESAYRTDDEDAEEGGDDEAYLETYESEDHDEADTENSAHSFLETDLPCDIEDEDHESEAEAETSFYRG